MKKAGIIGSGVGGMCTAIRLAQRGYEVTVFEANAYPGGKLTSIEQGGYRFDAGPSLFTMPQYLEELFVVAGKSFSDYCPYIRLDPVTHYFFPDGTFLVAHADTDKLATELSSKLEVSEAAVKKKLQQSKKIFELTEGLFLQKSLHKLRSYSTRALLNAGLGIRSLDLFSTMHEVNSSTFSDARAVQFFDRYATYNGSDPYRAPGTLNIIPHLEFNIGAFLPEEGMHAITKALYRLADELGVSFHFNENVEEIILTNNTCSGIRSGIHSYHFDLVVSNMDIVPTYKKLLPGIKAPERTLSQPRSSSALIFYWGVNRIFEQLDVHNIFFSADYQAEFDHLFTQADIIDDPTVYINITSKKIPGDAPPGGENWFVMINAPNNTGQDWDGIIDRTRKNILDKLQRMLGTDISAHIDCESILDPRTIESRTSSFRGALYGSSSNNRYAAFLRHANFSRKIKNLYFCGGSVHPGGGIPLCVLSAKIVDEVIHN